MQPTNIPERRERVVCLASGRVFSLAQPPPPLRVMVVVVGQEHECVGGGRRGWTPLGALGIHVGFERGFLEYKYEVKCDF